MTSARIKHEPSSFIPSNSRLDWMPRLGLYRVRGNSRDYLATMAETLAREGIPRRTMTTKTTSERVQALRQRRDSLGLTRLEVYANPADHQQIKDLAEKLRNRRMNERRRQDKAV
jgi:hypothetical protein